MRNMLSPRSLNAFVGLPLGCTTQPAPCPSFQKPRQHRIRRTKHSSGKYPPNIRTIKVSFSAPEARLRFRYRSNPTMAFSCGARSAFKLKE
jgi:hypothetical protein